MSELSSARFDDDVGSLSSHYSSTLPVSRVNAQVTSEYASSVPVATSEVLVTVVASIVELAIACNLAQGDSCTGLPAFGAVDSVIDIGDHVDEAADPLDGVLDDISADDFGQMDFNST